MYDWFIQCIYWLLPSVFKNFKTSKECMTGLFSVYTGICRLFSKTVKLPKNQRMYDWLIQCIFWLLPSVFKNCKTSKECMTGLFSVYTGICRLFSKTVKLPKNAWLVYSVYFLAFAVCFQKL